MSALLEVFAPVAIVGAIALGLAALLILIAAVVNIALARLRLRHQLRDGVTVIPIGKPRKPVVFLSPEWDPSTRERRGERRREL